MNKQPKTPTAETLASPKSSLPLRLWTGTCVFYTAISLSLLIVTALMSDSLTGSLVDSLRFLLLFPFSFLLSAARQVRHTETLPTAARVILHVLFCLGGFYLTVYLPYQITRKPTPQQILMILFLALLAYAVIMGVILLITGRFREKRRNETTYESQFGRKN